MIGAGENPAPSASPISPYFGQQVKKLKPRPLGAAAP
jgi:hypothetical protein